MSLTNSRTDLMTASPTTAAVYDENTIQRNFYDESCSLLIESVLEGFNGTIFAYGQVANDLIIMPTAACDPVPTQVLTTIFSLFSPLISATATADRMWQILHDARTDGSTRPKRCYS